MVFIERIPSVVAWNDPAPRVEHNEALTDWYTAPDRDELIAAFECQTTDRALEYLREQGDEVTLADAQRHMDIYAELAANAIALEVREWLEDQP